MKSTLTWSMLIAVMVSSIACTMHTKERTPDSAAPVGELTPEERFPTSLHAGGLSNGRESIYEDGPGRLTNVHFRDLPCQKCHAETYADGTPVDEASYEPSCRDCHATPGDEVPQDRCLQCHEAGIDQYSVHREAGL